jgi:NADPH-dependent glutamate synthase beta subunit-like oxidoreductase
MTAADQMSKAPMAWLADIQAGRREQAWRQLVADNPLPAIHGRVCYHPCETVCNRAQLDSSVSIHGVERYLGDLALGEGWAFDPPPPTGQRIAGHAVVTDRAHEPDPPLGHPSGRTRCTRSLH